MAALQAYEWPGNVRELRNLVEHLLIMMPGSGNDLIRADMLPSTVSQGAPSMARMDSDADVMALPLREARDLFETQYLHVQLMRFGGNISRTASFRWHGKERAASQAETTRRVT